MEIAFLVGRIIVGLYFLYNAFNHFTKTDMMAGYAGSKGVPAPKLAVLGSGLLLLIGGASILLGFYPKIGIVAVVLFLLGVSFKMHDFWAVQDPNQKMSDQINFLKNMALLGAALMFLAIPEPWPYSLGGGGY